jgi:endonuclease/exonuclease/phosphatase (EEP) superfamily protein YafD
MTRLPRACSLRRICILAGIAVLVASAFTLGARLNWFFELFSHFRWQYALVGGCVAPMLWRMDARALAVLCFGAFLLHVWAIGTQRLGQQAPQSVQGFSVRVMSFNVRHRSTDYGGVMDVVLRSSPDVLCLYETTHAWQQNLKPLVEHYAFSMFAGSGARAGFACFSRERPVRVEAPSADGTTAPWMSLHFERAGTSYSIIGAHLEYPLFPATARRRNQQLAALARKVGTGSGPTIVVGDFNLTPFSPYDVDFTTAADVQDCARGRSLEPTWPTLFAPLWIQIDRCFVSPGVGVSSYAAGSRVGSDHYPLLMEFVIPVSAANPSLSLLPASSRLPGQG